MIDENVMQIGRKRAGEEASKCERENLRSVKRQRKEERKKGSFKGGSTFPFPMGRGCNLQSEHHHIIEGTHM